MLPGDTVPIVISRRTAGGRPSGGLALSDFGFGAFHNGVAASVSPSIVDLGADGDWQRYRCSVVLPATKGRFQLFPRAASGTDQVEPSLGFLFDYDNADLDTIYSLLAVPVVSVVDAGGPLGDISLRCVRDTYVPVAFTVRDQANNAINLSGYNNAKFAVASQDQVTTTYLQTTGITMLASGLVTVAIPEGASFYAALPDAWSSSVGDEKTLYWTFIADEAADPTKTRCLARGRITVMRNEA